MRLLSRLSLVVVIFSAQIAAQVIFSEGFEGSTSGWTVSTSPASTGWEFGTPTVVGPASPPEGVRCAGTVLNGQYANSTTYQLTSPSITLPANAILNLTYYAWLGRETCCDHASLDIERNGTWTRVNYDSGSTSWRLITTNIDSYSGSSIRLRFTFTSDGSVLDYGWYVDDIKISYASSVNLSIQNDPNGTTTPSGTVSVRSNSPSNISATPNTNFRFDRWNIQSGAPVFADSFSVSTTVTTSTDATIRANFKPCSVYTIESSQRQYNYTRHYYSGSQSSGVRFQFTAPSSGNYLVNLQNVNTHSNYLYYYGTNSSFSTILQSASNSSSTGIAFHANAGEVHFFSVYTSSSTYYNYNFNINYSNAPILTINNDGNGTTNPSGSIAVVPNISNSITATPNPNYRFDRWSIQSGTPVITDSYSTSTMVTTSTDANIWATFKPCSIYTIASSFRQYNYTQHYYSGNQSTGVRFQFIAPSTGNYSVNLQNLQSHSNYLYYYGTSSTFSSVLQTASNSTNTTIAFNANAGEIHYFMVYTSSSSYYNYNFNINYSNTPYLTINNDGNGTTTPTGIVAVIAGASTSITASPSTGFRFNKWTIQSGNPVFADSFSISTTVTTSANASVRATFKPCSIYTIAPSFRQYNYTQHYYSGNPSSGVRYQFIAPSTGSYSVNLQNLQSHSNYLYYYGTSSTFSSALQTASNSTNTSIAFRANAGEIHYFMVYTSSSSYYNYNFNINYSNTPSLTINNDGNGTTTPTGIIAVISGASTSITASPSTGFRFNKWTIQSGTPVITDSFSISTTVTTSTDANVRATFKPCSIYTIASSFMQYNYTQHYYSGNPSTGVRFQFIAPSTGSYSVNLQNLQTHSNYLYYYGTSSTFSSALRTVSNSTNTSIAFRANAGEIHYFMVYTSSSSYYNYNFNINYSNTPSLTINNDGNGTTTPTGIVAVISGASTSITASPSTGFRFNWWTIQSGTPVFADSFSISTTVTTSADASVRATFKPCSIYTIASSFRQYNYTQHYYSGNPSTGVRFQFIAPSTGNYSVNLQNLQSHSNYLYYYGTSSTFSSALQTASNSTNTSIAFRANAGEIHYFMVYTSSSSYYNYNFNINYSNALSLTINNDGNGTTTPSGNTAITPNFATSITATPVTGYRFNKWSIISGNPVFSDSFSTPATVTTSTDATIRANFKPCSVYTITSTPVQYNYNQNYYTSVSNGVRFKFTAPISGTMRITLQNTSSHSNYIYDYGRDSLFNSYVNYYSNSSTTQITITANAGENHYFRVYTSSSSYYNSTFNIFYSPPLTFTISKSGSGWTSPSGTLGVISGVATSISAVPSGGYLFQNWTVVRGNPVIASATSATTTVTATTDSSQIRANFIINPNTRPNVQISDINISSHPDICVTASVTDSAGRSIVGLDTNDFILTQDSATVPYQLTTVSNVSGVSVALVLDASGSMDGTPLANVKTAALQYVRSMGPLDRCAIVSFGSTVHINQTVTSDTSLLISAINNASDGGSTVIKAGTMAGVQQLVQETNTRAVIVYSDGGEGSSVPTLRQLIDTARFNHTVIYSIGIGSGVDSTNLKPQADSTGGYYTYSPTTAGLASIYAQIKNDVQAQYILCYQTPDAIFNGDTHQVVLSVSLNSHTSKDTVYWNENNNPPVITLTAQTAGMIGVSQTANQPMTITADVTDDGSILQARLFYRRSNTTAGSFTEVPMLLVSGSLYQYTIPAAQIISPGIDFYILATDNYHLIGRSPNVLAPETQPYVIPVGNDVPVITHTPANCVIPALDLAISPTITDQNGISIALLYFKRGNETFYTIDTMNLTSANIFTGTVPGSMISTNGIDYYFRAIDTRGAAVRQPRSGSIHLSVCGNTNPPVANAGTDTTLYTNSNSCVVSATLDGTGSTNPDGGTLTYSWTGPFTGPLPGATPSINLGVGTNQIILSVTNNVGLTDLDTVVITVRDTFPPTPSQTSLTDITAQCSITLTPPTATDNCGGIINGTTPTTAFNTQDTFNVEWTYRDPSGNTSRQWQRVIIRDNTPPVPSPLSVITGNCSAVITNTPTATDNCSGVVTVTTTDPLVYNQPGNYTITWRYADGNGNSTTRTQSVVINDLTPPVPVVSNLAQLSSNSSLTVTTIPTAFDSCTRKIIIGSTTNPLTYNSPGIYTITWTYTDSSGNTSSQQQQVSIIDNIAPVPDSLLLDTIRGECSATVTDTPTATDNFCGIIHGVTSDPLTYSTQGIHTITWNYTDNSGNTSTQTQLVIIDDVTPPVPLIASLSDIQNECSVSITNYPQASDNCGTIITATTTSPLTYNNQGKYTIVWTYNDGNGNTVTQDQTVIINDSTPPVISTLSNRVITIQSTASGANIPIETAHATDNCTQVSVQGVRSDGLRLDTLFNEGTTSITWTACDTNSNCTTATQSITVVRNHAPLLQIPADTSLSEGEILSFVISASDSDGTIPSIFIDSLTFPFVFKDSANGQSTLSLRPGCTDHGIYTIKVHATDGIDTTTKAFAVNIKDINYPPEFDTTSYFVAHELVEFKTTIKVYDCDNPNPKIRIINAPKGAQFTDNNNGTGTFVWTPGGSDNGFYMVIFEAQDDMTTVRDTIIIEITDVNAYPPELTVSVSDSTVPLHLPVVIYATARDRDGPLPILRTSTLPAGSQFDTDNSGNAIFRWTPKDTGTFRFDFVAIDAADTTVTVTKQVKLTVADINVTGPKFSPVQNFIIDQNKLFSTTIEARDPDGTIPALHLKSGQQTDLTFKDNGNGTATISWIPPCNVTGTFYLTATASDQSITDSVTFTITVRDVNCPPVIFRTSDVNAKTGEMVRIYVRAYDPDGDTVIPTLSAGCTLPGYSFTNSGNGTGVFRWQVSYESGSYPVTFYASDGFETDSFTMHININMTGYVTIISTTSGSYIFSTPCGPFTGEFLGIDSARLGVAPGIYHFEVSKTGYRSERFAVKVSADSSVVKVCTLKTSIPLMTSLVDTMFLAQAQSQYHSASVFTDLNNDGYLDFTVLSPTGIKVFPGLDSSGIKFNSKSYDFQDSIPAASIFHYGFVDWNNDKSLDCIYSDLSGNIIVANFRSGTFESVVSVPGGKLYLSVLDVNNDHKKDLIIHNEGYGLSVYLNQGTDNSPVFTSSYQLAITSGQTPAMLHGPCTFIDIDGDGNLELLIRNVTIPSIFKMNSNFTEMSYIEDLNCAGKRISSDSLQICQIGSPSAMPHIILRTATQSILLNTHLLGDVNYDNKVDIRDISKISRLWEITDTDPSWDPQCNLRLSTSGQEKIDIRDISQAGKCWELQQ
jgi:VWFA-related protein